MKKEIITQEERINTKTQEIRAQRQRRARRNQKIAIAVSSVCAVALLAGIGAFSISMMNRNSNSATKQAAPAKLAAVTQTVQKPQEIQIKVLKNRNGSKGETCIDYIPMFNFFAEKNSEAGTAAAAAGGAIDGSDQEEEWMTVTSTDTSLPFDEGI